MTLGERQVNCTLNGNHPKTVDVSAGETTTVSFELSCPLARFNRIAFMSSRAGNSANVDIYDVAPNGSDLRRITSHSSTGEAPAWSPDGTRIAFMTSRTGTREMFTVRPNGSDLRRLTNNSAFADDPTWSPDGSRIAFATEREVAETADIRPPSQSWVRVCTLEE